MRREIASAEGCGVGALQGEVVAFNFFSRAKTSRTFNNRVHRGGSAFFLRGTLCHLWLRAFLAQPKSRQQVTFVTCPWLHCQTRVDPCEKYLFSWRSVSRCCFPFSGRLRRCLARS